METATDKVPNTSATAASASSDLNGMAIMVCTKYFFLLIYILLIVIYIKIFVSNLLFFLLFLIFLLFFFLINKSNNNANDNILVIILNIHFKFQNACNKIMERLKSVIDKNPNGTWEEWVTTAYLERISLSAAGFYKTPDIQYSFETNTGNVFNYFTYGVACSEVEIDCLTGDHQVNIKNIFT